jgi:PAS domain S-box-containing protein
MPEIAALKTLGITFGAAIKRRRLDEELMTLKVGIERSNDVVFVTNEKGQFEYLNQAFTQLYGYTLEDLKYQTPRVLKSGRQTQAFYERFWQTLLAKQVVSADIVNKTKTGQLVAIRASANPIMGKQGEIVGFLAIQRDVEEERSREELLRLRSAELEKLNALMIGREVKMAELKRRLNLNQQQVEALPVATGSMSELTVAAVMSRPVVTIEAQASILAAARMMAEKKVGALVVTIGNGGWGMITERDFLNFTAESLKAAMNTTVAEVMTTPVITVVPEMTIEAASQILREKNIRRLPVVENGKLVGIVTQTTLILALREQVIGALNQKMVELDRMNKLMVGRELKMAEMKQAIRRREDG